MNNSFHSLTLFRIPESGKHYILTQGPIDKEDQRHRTLSSSMMLMLGNTGGKYHIIYNSCNIRQFSKTMASLYLSMTNPSTNFRWGS